MHRPLANRVRRRRQPIPWSELSDWRRKVDGIANPIRRELQLFLLFTVPLASLALEVLQRRKADNPHRFADDHGWVFPARHRDGSVTHVIEAKENRTIDGRHVAYLPSPHRLRDTFASAAHEARIHPLDLKVLLNHALPATDDVTEGYVRPSIEHLRGCVEGVAQFLLQRMLTIGLDDRLR